MGRRQGGGCFLDQTEAAGAEGSGAGATLGLNDVGTGGHQINGQLLLLIKRQHVGHGDAQHHLGQQRPGAAGELEHLGGVEDAAEGIEGVVVADLHEGGTGLHGGGEQLGIHSTDADRQTGGLGGQPHQLGITGHVDQIGSAQAGGAADASHAGGIEVGEAGDHLEGPTLGQGRAQRGGQLGETRHAGLELQWIDSPTLCLEPGWGHG